MEGGWLGWGQWRCRGWLELGGDSGDGDGLSGDSLHGGWDGLGGTTGTTGQSLSSLDRDSLRRNNRGLRR